MCFSIGNPNATLLLSFVLVIEPDGGQPIENRCEDIVDKKERELRIYIQEFLAHTVPYEATFVKKSKEKSNDLTLKHSQTKKSLAQSEEVYKLGGTRS